MKKIELDIHEVTLTKDIISNNKHIFELSTENCCIKLTTRHYDPVENFMINYLGATASHRIGKNLYAICDDEKLLVLRTLEGDMVFMSNTEARFDGNKEYVEKKYGITSDEFLTVVKENFKSKKLVKSE